MYHSLFLQLSALRSFGKKPGHSVPVQHLLPISEGNCREQKTKETSFSPFFLPKDFFSPKTIINNMTSNSNLSNMRRLVEQLKLEASVERIKVKLASLQNTTACFLQTSFC